MYNALVVAKHIIDYSNSHGYGISNLKLQKVLYFVQAEFLVSKEDHSPCFSDTIEAWDFGPVVPAVYHRYKVYGGSFIPHSISDPLLSLYQQISEDDKTLINGMVDQLKDYSASTLVRVTHNQDPWKNAYVRGFSNPISNHAIRTFFEG